MQKYAIFETEQDAKNCKDCGAEGGHLRGLFPVGEDRIGATGSVCPEGPRAGTDDALCDRCESDMTGERVVVIQRPGAGDKAPLAACEACVTAVVEGGSD